MATYNVGGLSVFNRKKTIHEALASSLPGDEIQWIKTNKWDQTLEVRYGTNIKGTRGKLKVPEHSVGMVIRGSGNLIIEDLNFQVGQLSNAVSIDWVGTLTFKGCDFRIAKKAKSDKSYPTIFSDNARGGLNINFIDCVIEGANIAADTIMIERTSIEGDKLVNVFSATDFDARKSSISNIETSATTISLSNVNVDRGSAYYSEMTRLRNVDVGTHGWASLSLEGNADLNEVNFSTSSELSLCKGAVDFTSVIIPEIEVTATEVDLRIHDGVSDSGSWTKVDTKIANQTEKELSHEVELSAVDELQGMIGLESVKETMDKYMAMARITRAREKAGVSEIDYSLHLSFNGNPGTGKSTVAKIFAKGLYEEGILSTTNVYRVGRSDLVDKVIGGTALKTLAVLEKARGGVLFIDEAYTLSSSDKKDFANEAVTVLVDYMEEHRKDLVVILAGYTDKMKELFDTANPGLKSRFTNWVNFEDYSLNELQEIMLRNIKSQYEETPGDVIKLANRALSVFWRENLIEGNARFVRNLVQEISFAHSVRTKNEGDFSKKSLTTLTNADVNTGYKRLYKQLLTR